MPESARPLVESHVTQIQPDARLVVLARTMQAHGSGSETAWDYGVSNWTSFGETCVGQALYRHCSVFQSSSDAPVWSHLELSYFRDIVPVGAIHDLVFKQRPGKAQLLRAEILLTTPSAFLMPQGWQGSADRRERQASLEYINVRPGCLSEYRDVMRKYIGPAAAKLVGVDRIGTFRAMETAAVLYRDPLLNTDWNQIHLCEVHPGSFKGFGQEFDAALREISPDGGSAGVFADLDRMRTISRWTFNEPVIEADIAVGKLGFAKPPLC
jgi:hypothetical protein